jgi:transposase
LREWWGCRIVRSTWPCRNSWKFPFRIMHSAGLIQQIDFCRVSIGSLTERIRQYDRKLEAISKEHYPETALLRQVEGIGPLTALTFVLTLEDPYRFERSRSVGAYLGLVPARDQSGDRDPHKRISKEGDEMLRRLVVGSAHYTTSLVRLAPIQT